MLPTAMLRRSLTAGPKSYRLVHTRKLGHDAHHETHVEEARFLGERKSRVQENYELPTYLLVFLGSAAAIAIYYAKPNTNIAAWAREEALYRQKMRENGEEVIRGVNHAQEAKMEAMRSGWKKT